MECHICDTKKEFSEFYQRKDPRCKGGVRYTRPCKACTKRRSKYIQDRMTPQQRRDKWNNWREENKEKFNEKMREKRKDDINHKLSDNIRRRTSTYILRNLANIYKTEYGASKDIFRKWIEFQFVEEMKWESYGKHWEFDHIQPLREFDLTNRNEVKKCCHYSNLQPLTRERNAKKHSNIDTRLIEEKKRLFEIFQMSLNDFDA